MWRETLQEERGQKALEGLGMLAGSRRARVKKSQYTQAVGWQESLMLRVHSVCIAGSESWFYAVCKEAVQLSYRDT